MFTPSLRSACPFLVFGQAVLQAGDGIMFLSEMWPIQFAYRYESFRSSKLRSIWTYDAPLTALQ